MRLEVFGCPDEFISVGLRDESRRRDREGVRKSVRVSSLTT